jgi:hypothetical protein
MASEALICPQSVASPSQVQDRCIAECLDGAIVFSKAFASWELVQIGVPYSSDAVAHQRTNQQGSS